MLVALIYFCAWGSPQPCGPESALRTVRLHLDHPGNCALDAQVIAASGAQHPILGREVLRVDCPTQGAQR